MWWINYSLWLHVNTYFCIITCSKAFVQMFNVMPNPPYLSLSHTCSSIHIANYWSSAVIVMDTKWWINHPGDSQHQNQSVTQYATPGRRRDICLPLLVDLFTDHWPIDPRGRCVSVCGGGWMGIKTYCGMQMTNMEQKQRYQKDFCGVCSERPREVEKTAS